MWFLFTSGNQIGSESMILLWKTRSDPIIQALMKTSTSRLCARISKTSTRVNQKPRYEMFLFLLFPCYFHVANLDLCWSYFNICLFRFKLDWQRSCIIHHCSKIYIKTGFFFFPLRERQLRKLLEEVGIKVLGEGFWCISQIFCPIQFQVKNKIKNRPFKNS